MPHPRVVTCAFRVAIAGAVFIGLSGAAAGAALVAGSAMAGTAVLLDENTFMAALHVALMVSGLMAVAGAVTSLPWLRVPLVETTRPEGRRVVSDPQMRAP